MFNAILSALAWGAAAYVGFGYFFEQIFHTKELLKEIELQEKMNDENKPSVD